MKKLVCVILCIALFPAAVFAAAGFDDLAEDHWAVAAISLAKENGIIEGYHESGTWLFRPDNNVSRQECVTMLYRTLAKAGLLDEELLGEPAVEVPAGDEAPAAEQEASAEAASTGAALSDEGASEGQSDAQQAADQTAPAVKQSPENALISKWEDTMKSCGIAEWAYGYCAYFFEKEIVEAADFGSAQGAGFGGGVPASRQLIARWTARAMDYGLSSLCRVVYSDYSDIDPENRAYVDALYRKHIMEGSDGRFHGKDGVRRSEMAAVCTRLLGIDPKFAGMADADPAVDARGVLSSVSASDRTIVLSSPSAEFYVPEGTRVALDGAASGLSELSSLKGQKISLSAFAGGDGSVMVQSAPAVLHGTVRNIWDYGRYDAVSIELENGIRVTLVTGADSDVPGIRRNHSYDFISDGILILEMR